LATSSEIEEYRSTVDNLAALAVRDLSSALQSLEGQPPVTVRDSLIELFPELIQPYATASGEVSAVWYEDLRAQALSTPFYATASPEVNQERINALVRFGVKPLFGQSESTVLSLMGGGVQRIVTNAARETIDTNAKKDAASVSWSRVVNPGRAKSGKSCDFCIMLAGRGDVYRSAEAAGMVIGRGVDPSKAINDDGSRKAGGQGQGVKARGTRALNAKAFHDDCHCAVVPTFYEVSSFTNPRTGREERALFPIT
jgi:hypothetical protein